MKSSASIASYGSLEEEQQTTASMDGDNVPLDIAVKVSVR